MLIYSPLCPFFCQYSAHVLLFFPLKCFLILHIKLTCHKDKQICKYLMIRSGGIVVFYVGKRKKIDITIF